MNKEQPASILWHDFETWGVNPSVDFPVQFAAVRTDEHLNILEDYVPINWMCTIPHDYLPHPQACMITGISPSLSVHKGLSEPLFAQRIYEQMSKHNTCVAGYNSMRFDEEVTRHLFYRNLFPVYEREYKHNNSRWDIIDLVRAAYALRPEGINWPLYEDGKPCFKLDRLTVENNISHESAHDALSDVYATIAIAKLVKQHQPKLFDYFWQLRRKQKVEQLLAQFQSTLLVHISSFISAENGCCAIVMPICRHPNNNNAIICIDVNSNIEMLRNTDSEQLKTLIYTKASAQSKPIFFTIATNKCPFIAPLNTLSAERAQQLSIDINAAKANYQKLKVDSSLINLVSEAFTQQHNNSNITNIDDALYATEFPQPADMQLMEKVRLSEPEQLVVYQGAFNDNAINQRLFRYRARNFTQTLEEHELHAWQRHLQDRFTLDHKKECLSLREYFGEVERLMAEHANVPKTMQLLKSLQQYGQHISGA
ncbi:MAG: exodeoxyribonuclease I [Glaciecola sp.]